MNKDKKNDDIELVSIEDLRNAVGGATLPSIPQPIEPVQPISPFPGGGFPPINPAASTVMCGGW